MAKKEFDSISYALVDLFEHDDHHDSELFHESTKLTRATYGRMRRRVGLIQNDLDLIIMMSRSWKTYTGFPRATLPPAELGAMSAEEALRTRRSQVGRFAGGPITAAQLSAILRYSYGFTAQVELPRPGEAMRLRAAPSGGGLYPLEIYPVVFDVDGFAPGVYHYRVVDHSLEELRRCPAREEFLEKGLCAYPELMKTAAVVLAISAVLPRTMTKYLFRGYRFLSYDVGALTQNLYLTGTALGLGTVAIGGFYDDEVGAYLDLDNVDEQVMLLFAFGQPGPAVPDANGKQ